VLLSTAFSHVALKFSIGFETGLSLDLNSRNFALNSSAASSADLILFSTSLNKESYNPFSSVGTF